MSDVTLTITGKVGYTEEITVAKAAQIIIDIETAREQRESMERRLREGERMSDLVAAINRLTDEVKLARQPLEVHAAKLVEYDRQGYLTPNVLGQWAEGVEARMASEMKASA